MLIALVADGNQDAFSEFFDLVSPVVFGIARRDQIAAALADPMATVEILQNETGMLRIITVPGSQDAVLVGSWLPDLGDAQTYQLWAIDGAVEGAAPVSAGTFGLSDGEIRAILRLTNVNDPVWAVSVEPAGGSPQTTGENVLLSA